MEIMEKALREAIDIAGGQAALSRAVGVSQPSVWYWLNKSKRVAAEYVLKVEAVTQVPRHALRPDLYPEIGKPAADDAAGATGRMIICDVCERRVDGEIPNACTFVDCPHSQRAANMGIAA
jgi:DNA-binding transcriptional regulator YdaS (Cro superfamily)